MSNAKRITIKHTFIKWFLLISLLPVIVTSSLIYYGAKNDIEAEIIDYLAAEIVAQSSFINDWFDNRFKDVERLSSSPATKLTLESLSVAYRTSGKSLGNFVNSIEWEEISSEHREYFLNQWYMYDYIYDVFIIDNGGNILFSIAKEDDLGTNLFTGKYAQTKFGRTVKNSISTGRILFSDLERYQPSNMGVYGFIVTPVINDIGEKIGALAVQIKLDRINQLLESIENTEGHNFIIASSGEYRSASSERIDSVLRDKTPVVTERERVLLDREYDVKAYRTRDIDHHPVISVWHPLAIGGVEWVVINETHDEDAFAILNDILISSLIVVMFTILIVIYGAFISSSRLANPIKELTRLVARVQRGENIVALPEAKEIELDELSKGLMNMLAARREQEQKLHNMVNFQEAILNNLGEALIIIDRKGVIQRFSTDATNIFGYQEQEVVGQNIKMLMPQAFAKHHDRYLDDYKGGLKTDNVIGKTRELQGMRKDGSVFYIELVVTSIFNEEKELFVGLVKDITGRIETQNALVTALRNSDAANRAKSEFLANMSHEIRTPMNGVYGSLQVLKQDTKDPASIDLIDKALFSCRNQLTIINDILDFSKIEAGMLTLETVPFSFTEVVHLVISEITPTAEIKSIDVTYDFEAGAHDGWYGDPVRIKQVLLNLVANAVKFTESGQVSIHVKNAEEHLVFCIEDTGIGMTQEQVGRLFKRFEQADTSTTRKFGGTGLGMAITEAIIGMMKGTISVDSELGKGTNFQVEIPLDKAEVEVKTKERTEHKTPELSGKKILLAEDNRINQKVFLAMMKPTNATIEIANNGKEAIELVDSFEPDFIFMDIQMPEMDGMEACRRIKLTHKTLPIVALTANVMEQDVKKYKMLGFDGHVGKPIEISDLYQPLVKFLLD